MFCFFPKKNIIANQFIFAVLLFFIVMASKGLIPALSVGLGFSVALLPTLAFQNIFFTKRKQLAPNQIVNNFYFAAIFKFLLLITLFIACAQWSELEANLFFLSFALMQITCWGGNLLRLRAGNQNER